MTTPTVQFVDFPSLAAGVRLDLTNKVEHDDFSLGHPVFNGAPGSVGVEYDYREGMSMTVRVGGTEAAALAVHQSLAREVVRTSNWLLYRQTPTSTPVWFKTYPTQPGDLSLDFVNDDPKRADHWRIHVPLAADPFTYGAQETVVTNAVVSFDPAAGTNPTRYDVTGTVKGDFRTPASVRLTWSADRHGMRHLLATTRTAGYVWQAGTGDGWTAGTDTGVAAADATFSGGSYRPVTFTTVPTMVDRLTGPAPAALSNGDYRVLVRVGRSTTTDEFAFRFGIKVQFTYTYGPTVATSWGTSTGANHAAWVDLGVYSFPLGTSDQGGSHTPDVALGVQRLSGAGQARIDAIKLIPVTDTARTMFVDHPDLGPAGAYGIEEYHDGDRERMLYRNIFGPMSTQPALPAGGWPLLEPGTNNNVVHVLSQTAPNRARNFWQDAADVIAGDAKLTLSYFPLYLNLAP